MNLNCLLESRKATYNVHENLIFLTSMCIKSNFYGLIKICDKFKPAATTLYLLTIDCIFCFVLLNGIIHQTNYEKSDWSRAFNQFTIACELGMINAISAADIAFMRFKVCLVTKPLGVFSETKWLNASVLFLRMNYVKNV